MITHYCLSVALFLRYFKIVSENLSLMYFRTNQLRLQIVVPERMYSDMMAERGLRTVVIFALLSICQGEREQGRGGWCAVAQVLTLIRKLYIICRFSERLIQGGSH